MTIRRLVLLRHGQTEFNADSRMQGQLDTDLTDLGRAQAVAAAEVLAKRQPIAIVSSDLRRAYDTACSLGERTGLPVAVDTRLRETHLGDWQGMTHIEVDTAVPGARLAWREDARWAPHGGENRVDVARRSIPLVAELVDAEPQWGRDDVDRPVSSAGGPFLAGEHRSSDRPVSSAGGPFLAGEHRSSDRPVVLVAHGGLIAALTAGLLRLPVDNWPVLGGMGNASWVQLSGHTVSGGDVGTFDDINWRLDVWNASAQVTNDVL